MNHLLVESALATLRPGLGSDGFDLRIAEGEQAPGVVQVVLEATVDACADCLVPDEMLVRIIEAAIREQGEPLDHVVLVKEGFDNLH